MSLSLNEASGMCSALVTMQRVVLIVILTVVIILINVIDYSKYSMDPSSRLGTS